MAQSDRATEATFNCPSCGALYEVTVLGHLNLSEKGAVTCEVCGKTMQQWSSASPPSFRLIKRPNNRVGGKQDGQD